jgi:hypothetical protein
MSWLGRVIWRLSGLHGLPGAQPLGRKAIERACEQVGRIAVIRPRESAPLRTHARTGTDNHGRRVRVERLSPCTERRVNTNSRTYMQRWRTIHQ